jgi:hypothetical protein
MGAPRLRGRGPPAPEAGSSREGVSRHPGSFTDVTSTSRLDASRPTDATTAGRTRRVARRLGEDFATVIRGYGFAARPPGAPEPQVGAPALLVREPDNPRDRLAVAVWLTAGTPWRLGYLDRTVAARLAPRLDGGQAFDAELSGWVEVPDTARQRPLVRVRTREPSPEVPAAGGRGAALWGRPPRSTRRTIS